MRVPGIVRWPNHIKPGVCCRCSCRFRSALTVVLIQSTSSEIVTTYDIFPTVLSLAGIPMPTDRVFDGKDVSQVRGNRAQPGVIFVTHAIVTGASQRQRHPTPVHLPLQGISRIWLPISMTDSTGLCCASS